MTRPEIQTFLRELPPGVRALVEALRSVVREVAPEAEESILWGGLSYHPPQVGGRVKGTICQIGTKGGEVRLEFIHGVRIPDPDGILRGNRVSKRYIPIHSIAEARHPRVADLVRKAAAVQFE